MTNSDPGRVYLDIASVLLVTSVLFIIALVLLTIALMRMRGMTRRLQEALEDESGARDRAALLLAMASAVNSSLGLEEVLDVAIGHAGRIMGAVAGPRSLYGRRWRPCARSSSGWLKTWHRGSRPVATPNTSWWCPCSARAS